MFEKELEIKSGDALLAGTVCLPDELGCFPVVLMIHGSGPLDRNENMKGQRLDVFNTIAHYLAQNGIASVRYDKRGCGKSSGYYYSAGHRDLVDDAVNWFDALGQFEFFDKDRRFLLGHSEGSLIAPQVSLKRMMVAGAVLLCPFIEPIEHLLIKQAGQLQKDIENAAGISGIIQRIFFKLAGQPVTHQRKLIKKLKTSNSDIERFLLQKIPARWFRELFSIEPQTIFNAVTCPILVIGGEKDIQCDPSDVDIISMAAKGPVESHIIKNLTHILRCDENDPAFSSYAHLIKKPLETKVLELVSNWLLKIQAPLK